LVFSYQTDYVLAIAGTKIKNLSIAASFCELPDEGKGSC